MTFLKFTYRRQFIKYRCMVVLGTNRISKRSSSADPPRSMHVPRSSSRFRESPFLMFYFRLLSCQFILSPFLFLSSISFITKVCIHGSTKSLNRLSYLSISFSLHRFKFMGMLMIIMQYIDGMLNDYFYSVEFYPYEFM